MALQLNHDTPRSETPVLGIDFSLFGKAIAHGIARARRISG
jgi:hypothetical protein